MVQRDYWGMRGYVIAAYFFLIIISFSSLLAKSDKNIQVTPCIPGKIIFITGSCSAGKSSMAKIIAEKLNAKSFAFDDYVMPIVLKKFIAKHYGKFLAFLISGIAMRNFFSSVNLLSEKTKYKFQKKFLADLKNGLAVEPTTRMYNEVKRVAEQGRDVVVESPMFLFDGVTCLKSLKVFDDSNITYILAYCPWNNLIERLEKRNNSVDKKNSRELDWVLGNYVQYVNPFIRRHGKNYLEKVNGALVHSVVAKYAQPKHKKRRMHLLEETRQAVLSAFPTQAIYYVYPRFNYDIIINTNTHDPAQGAAIFLDTLLKVS